MISNKMFAEIELIAYATVSNMFATFHNEKYRGEKFEWSNFPKISEGLVATQVFMSIPIKNKKKLEEVQNYAKKRGYQIAEKLLKKMQE
jgi:hypothetical protein